MSNTVIRRKWVHRLTIRPHFRGGYHLVGFGAHLCRCRAFTARELVAEVRRVFSTDSYVIEVFGPDNTLFRTIQHYAYDHGKNGESTIWMDDKMD